MNHKMTQGSTRLIAFGVLALMLVSMASALTLSEWPVTNNPNNPNPTNVHANVNAGIFTFGTGFGTGLGTAGYTNDGASAGPWTTGSSPDSTEYFEVSLSPKTGYSFSLNEIDFSERRSNFGPSAFQVQWSKDAAFTTSNTVATITIPDNEESRTQNIPGLDINVISGETLYIRFFGYSAESAAGTWRIDRETLSLKGAEFSSNLTIASVTIPSSSDNVNLTITNTGSLPLSNVVVSKQSGDFDVTFNPSTIASISAGATQNVVVTMTTSRSSLNVGTNTVQVQATASGEISSTSTVSFDKSFCSFGPVNDSNLDMSVQIRNRGEGTNNEWNPLDQIDVKVELRNNYPDLDLRDINFELGLYKKGTNTNIIEDMIWISNDEDLYDVGDIDSGKKESYTFSFRIDPSEVFGSEDYVLVAKAYRDGKETLLCTDHSADFGDSDFGSSESFAEITIKQESTKNKMVVIDDYDLTPINVQCGERVSVPVTVYNIGDKDFTDNMSVNIYNNELGVNINNVIQGDLDSGDDARTVFDFVVPTGVTPKLYTLAMTTSYDYRENDGTYRESSSKSFNAYLNVACTVSSDVLISANLLSKATSGDEMTVRVTLTNTKDSSRTFTIEPTGYHSWAEFSGASSVLTVAPGSTGESSIIFNVKDDISGEQPFTLNIYEGADLIATQAVSVRIESSGFGGFTGFITGGDNAYLWGIGLLNIILILVIIFVAVRVSRK